VEKNTYVYTGEPILPNYSIRVGDRILSSDKDFDVEITDNINVGTAHVVFKGKGKFKGVIEKSFEIVPVHARALSFFADNTEFDYNGEPCIMQIAVKFGETTLIEGKDYTVEYENNTDPGTANAKLTFKGNFTGVMTIPFTIFGTKKKTPAAPRAAENELVNTSEISSDEISLGETVTVTASAKGGKPPYTYAVQYKKAYSKTWFTKQDFGSETVNRIKPLIGTRYHILVKVMDSAGTVAKKYFKLAVNKTGEAETDK